MPYPTVHRSFPRYSSRLLRCFLSPSTNGKFQFPKSSLAMFNQPENMMFQKVSGKSLAKQRSGKGNNGTQESVSRCFQLTWLNLGYLSPRCRQALRS